MGLPEYTYNESDDELPQVQNIITATDSDSEEDQDHLGYEPIPMNDCQSDDEEDPVGEGDTDGSPNNGVPDITPAEAEIVKEVWETSTRNEIIMDQQKVNEVMQAMNNFTLPLANIPDWACNVPEDMWREKLMEKLQNTK